MEKNIQYSNVLKEKDHSNISRLCNALAVLINIVH